MRTPIINLYLIFLTAIGGVAFGQPAFKAVKTSQMQKQIAIKATSKKMWINGDTVHFVYKGEGNKMILNLMLGVQIMMENPAPNTWVASLWFPNHDQAVYTGIAMDIQPGKRPTQFLIKTNVFFGHGKNAPALPKSVNKLEGLTLTHDFNSPTMKFVRKIEVYLPPHYSTETKPYPVLFAMDGLPNVKMIEKLIVDQKIPPVVLIGIPDGGEAITKKLGYDVRTIEFLEGAEKLKSVKKLTDSLHFKKFVRFFTQELMDWAKKYWNISTNPTERIMYGSSNGGAFTSYIAREYPALFGHLMPFSTGGSETVKRWQKRKKVAIATTKPKIYLTAGVYETRFKKITQSLGKLLKKRGYQVKERYPLAGHDNLMWETMLARYLQDVFRQ